MDLLTGQDGRDMGHPYRGVSLSVPLSAPGHVPAMSRVPARRMGRFGNTHAFRKRTNCRGCFAK
jgi:hypothetical protein